MDPSKVSLSVQQLIDALFVSDHFMIRTESEQVAIILTIYRVYAQIECDREEYKAKRYKLNSIAERN